GNFKIFGKYFKTFASDLLGIPRNSLANCFQFFALQRLGGNFKNFSKNCLGIARELRRYKYIYK
ncbi:unnamed protein product, partial [Arabidopsis halleri]